MHAFKYGKKEQFAIDFQVLHKKRDKVYYIGGCYEKKVVNFMYEESYDEAELSDSDF